MSIADKNLEYLRKYIGGGTKSQAKGGRFLQIYVGGGYTVMVWVKEGQSEKDAVRSYLQYVAAMYGLKVSIS